MDELLTQEALWNLSDKSQLLLEELSENDLPADFVPQAPMYVFHSTTDYVVPQDNSYSLREQLKNRTSKVTYDFADYGSHTSGFLTFYFTKLWEML